jgi:Dcp1-like decapping family
MVYNFASTPGIVDISSPSSPSLLPPSTAPDYAAAGREPLTKPLKIRYPVNLRDLRIQSPLSEAISPVDFGGRGAMPHNGGKLTPNLDQGGTKVLNLTVLQRIDPSVEDILITASHVTLYDFNIDLNQWV